MSDQAPASVPGVWVGWLLTIIGAFISGLNLGIYLVHRHRDRAEDAQQLFATQAHRNRVEDSNRRQEEVQAQLLEAQRQTLAQATAQTAAQQEQTRILQEIQRSIAGGLVARMEGRDPQGVDRHNSNVFLAENERATREIEEGLRDYPQWATAIRNTRNRELLPGMAEASGARFQNTLGRVVHRGNGSHQGSEDDDEDARRSNASSSSSSSFNPNVPGAWR